MKTSRWPVVFIVALFLLLAANIAYTIIRTSAQSAQKGDVRPAQKQPVVRVKNADERRRMEQYIADYYRPLKIVQSLKVPWGEQIDCVDMYTQPALQRKGMENHKIQLRPSQIPRALREGKTALPIGAEIPGQEYLKIGGPCPEGSIPIRRLTIDTLVRFQTLEDFFKKEAKTAPIEPPSCGGSSGGSSPHEYAHAFQDVANWGAESVLNVWNVWVEWSNEFALSQMWVVRGAGSNLQTLEAGWQSYKDKYGDWNAHLFIYSTQDNYASQGCYNLDCGQFVQTDHSVYIGGGFNNVSNYGGGQWVIKLLIARDPGSGNWWLWYGDTPVGYWPNSLYNATGLANQADTVDFGGEIVNTQPDGRHTDTDMGSGNYPSGGWEWAAYQSNLSYVDTNYFYADPTLTDTRTNAQCYDISLTDNSGSGWGDYFYFGGPGRNGNCP
jgi:hypothetical protein